MGKNICLSVQNIKITHLSFTTISITRKRTNVQRPNLIIKPKIKNNFVDAENEKRCILSTLRNYALTGVHWCVGSAVDRVKLLPRACWSFFVLTFLNCTKIAWSIIVLISIFMMSLISFSNRTAHFLL